MFLARREVPPFEKGKSWFLVNLLRSRIVVSPWHVMPLIYQRSSVVFNSVCIWGARSATHEDHTDKPAQPKVHASLKAYTFIGAHLHVRNDVPWTKHERKSLRKYWSGRWESNPRLKLGKLSFYH